MVRVLVCGALGKMGKEVVKAVYKDSDLELVGAVDINAKFSDISEIIGIEKTGILIGNDLQNEIESKNPQVVVDFTNPDAVMHNIEITIRNKVCPVVGTTGITQNNLQIIGDMCNEYAVSALISPNFSVGAILMMKLAQQAVKYFPVAEIIELHHDQKLDAPSGTALLTADLLAAARGGYLKQGHPNEVEKVKGARGSDISGIHVHSVRLPGYVAHQEVIFGGLGQTLTIRHDSISRESFMPGVVLACKKIVNAKGLVYGLEKLLD